MQNARFHVMLVSIQTVEHCTGSVADLGGGGNWVNCSVTGLAPLFYAATFDLLTNNLMGP